MYLVNIIVGDLMVYISVLVRVIFFYILIGFVYRLMGKREIGELSIMDLIVSFIVSELAAISIDNYESNILISVIPILVITLIEIITSRLVLKNTKVRDIFEGNPSVIINRGKINFKEMIRQRYNIGDLLTELRAKGIKSIEEVSYAVLETNGNLSVFTKRGKNFGSFPLPIILDGEIQEDTLKEIDKTSVWIEDFLKKESLTKEDVFYAFYHNEKMFIIKDEDIK